MKNNVRKWIVLLLCLALCLSLAPANAMAAKAADPIKIACIGDSITYGHNPADWGRTQIKNNWPTVLGQLLGDGYDVRNFGQNGITLLKSGGTPVWTIDRFTQSKDFQPDIVIIMLGTNDSPPATGWNKGEAFKADYKELIEVYRNLDSHPEVYVATCATAFGKGGFGLPPASIHENIVPLQKEIAKEMNCPVLDVHAATADLGDLFPDNIHPNEEGHKRIAQYIYTELINKEEPDDGIVGLKDAFAGKFKVGVAISGNEMRKSQVEELTLKHYNSVTCENEMKPDSTLDQAACQSRGNNVETQVRLTSSARSILKFCEDNHIPMRGHVIAWHSQTPSWFFREGFTNSGDYVTPEIMNQRLESFIRNLFALIATEYPNLEIYAWDVVNEAFTDSNPATMRPATQSGWIRVYGDNTFIYKAFEYARKYAPEGCMLCYNDYNEYDIGKLNAIYDLAKDLYEKGLLDAVGMQAHLTVGNPTISRFRAALEKYASIGCKVMVTELDVQMRNNDEAEQAEYYRQLFELLVEFHEKIEAVVFWGTHDGSSWRPNGKPLPFNNYEPKPLYWSILDAVSDHEHTFQEIVTEPTCTQDGFTTKVCTHEGCNRTVITNPTKALGHAWDAGVVTLEPTTTTAGIRTHSCTRCDATKQVRIPRIGATCPDSIDFTDPASADRFEVVNPDVTAIREGQGLYLVSTKDAMEPSNDQLSGSAATTPKDLVKIPVEGDWIATMKFKFDQGGSQGWYEFFGFYAMDDYNNLVGIRGGDGTMQDFLRKGGEITREQNSANIGGSGLKAASTHWFRMEKEGDSYTCYWSIDGENFTEMFSFENTGINGDYIVIDAYTGMAAGYNYLVESLEFEENGVVTPPVPQDLAIVTAPASFTGKIGDTATFSVAVNRTDVTYQWMFSNNGGKSWTNSTMAGSDTASVAVVMKAFRVGQMYKVVVTDSEGNSVESAVVSMTTATTGLKIVGNPVDSAAALGETATFTARAEGEGLTYQWMYSKNGGASWCKSTLPGSNTETVSVVMKAIRAGQMYQCVVTDASGNVVESTAATLTRK